MQPKKLLFALLLGALSTVPGCVGGRAQRSLAAPPTEATRDVSLPSIGVGGRDTLPATVRVPAWAVVKEKATEFQTPAEARVGVSLFQRDEAMDKEANSLLNEMAESKDYEGVEANGWTGYARRLQAPMADGPMRLATYMLRNETTVVSIQMSWPATSPKAPGEADAVARHILFSIKPSG
jgi:hypothetical protein